MISRITGSLIRRELDLIEIQTAGGLSYEIHIPLTTLESLPEVGESVTIHTSLVVKEELWQLFGFSSFYERKIFERLLTANGVGPSLAIGLLSSLSTDRLVRAIIDKDIATLQSVPRVGKKKAERLVLDLSDKIGTVTGGDVKNVSATSPSTNADEAIRALMSLGYSNIEADRAVRKALDDNTAKNTAELIRISLLKISGE